uniref:C2H2-type domain-containing protein n=1 Tax=Anthurium amnicola TaxID=1678845 RepID=A0A1D1XSI2_9ARAE
MADGEEVVPMEEIREEEDGEEEEQVEDWDDWKADEDDSEPSYLCLFCDLSYASSDDLFDHCRTEHFFDFYGTRRALGLDFYSSLKLINYVRAQVAENKCWSCGALLKCKNDLQKHLHAPINFGEDVKYIWDNDIYLKPFVCEDALLHNLPSDEEGEENYMEMVDKEELMRELMCTNDLSNICIDDRDLDSAPFEVDALCENGRNEAQATKEFVCADGHSQGILTNAATKGVATSHTKRRDKQLRVSFTNVIAREIKNINESYFGSYGSFGIHREMISDKVRTDTYRSAIMNNPSLMNGATVLDVGCGTGILSLFAAQAGASRVIAVEASKKMAAVASQIVKDNGLLLVGSHNGDISYSSGVINVVHGMIEELDKVTQVPPNSIDILVSEWMGYCLLYESMLTSVIYARDHWLRPGGAILPDVATIFVAGFGRGATSVPFWEDVYGFDMSCIGREVMENAAKVPILDVVDSHDIVTETVLVKSFDLATMKQHDMDFTSSFELEQRNDISGHSLDALSGVTWCYGIVLWFEAAFTGRFCKEMPYILSTSPYSPKTHWYQTIFTFNEPIAMATSKFGADDAAAVGTEKCPAVQIRSRISIARAAVHRSIDISLEITAHSLDGRKCSWPVQIFNL